uniref:SUI1 domain-containing protein n=1 Tax=Macrostomum lignano TaxID=282301 RepID=A0A1I8F2H5_9PLAT
LGNAKVDPLSSGPVANDATDCPVCGKPVPPGNAELHRVACDRAMRNRQLRAAVDGASAAVESAGAVGGKKGSQKKTGVVLGVASNQKSDGSAIKKQQANKKKQQAEAVDNNTEEDFDALLAEFAAMDSVCGYPDCKTPVRTVGHGCAHCAGATVLAISYRKFTAAVRLPERQPGESPSGSATSGPVAPPKSNREAVATGPAASPVGGEAGRHGAVKAAGVCCLCGGVATEKLAIKRRTRRNNFLSINKLTQKAFCCLLHFLFVARRRCAPEVAQNLILNSFAADRSTDLLEVASFASSRLNSKKAAAPQGRKTMTAADVELALVEFANSKPSWPAVRECLSGLRTRGRGAADEADAEDAELEQQRRQQRSQLPTLDDLDDIMNAVVSGTDDKEGEH